MSSSPSRSSPPAPAASIRVLEFSEYAEAGIPQYWIVDLGEPTSLLAYVLVDGNYELSGEHTGTATLEVAGHPVPVDLPALTRR